MAERRVDRIARRLRALGGRARVQDLLGDIRNEEHNADLAYQSVYMAIQLENQRLDELGERTLFITSREGESRGWVRLREASDFAQDSDERDLENQIQEKNTCYRVGKKMEGEDSAGRRGPYVAWLKRRRGHIDICKRNQIGVKK